MRRHLTARWLYAAIFVISAATLLLELTLTRIFDVLLWSNLAYLVVSGAIFGFGLGGIVLMRWPMRHVATERLLGVGAVAFAATVLLLIPALRFTPANFDALPEEPVRQLLAFGVLYVLLLAPFVAAGLVVATMVTRYARHIHTLYFWDLVGAGVGSLGIFVLPSLVGGEETLLVVAAGGALAASLVGRGAARMAGAGATLALAALTLVLADRIDFPSLADKRGIRLGQTAVEYSHWDPVSKIDVVQPRAPFWKRIVYDGGSQSSGFRRFDGDPAALRRQYFDTTGGESHYNSGKYVALAHWLKRDAHPRTLVIGSAGGQETEAGLAWGAAHVRGVEMVCTVVELGKGRYAAYIGHIFTNPRVTVTCDEGRSFLRHTAERYDIIQIHSNHTYSSLANGSGGAMPIYLQTVEAYKDYLTHMTDDGILQINYIIYPRMITTAARAWGELFPGQDFRRHLVITSGYPTMETFLVKRSEWTPAEIAEIRRFLSPEFADIRPYSVIYAPGEPEARNVPDEFFRVPLSPRLEASLPYRISPPTDDRPFFRDLRKRPRFLQPDSAGYIPPGTADHLNASLRKGFIPMESLHLYVLGGLSVLMAAVFLLVPLASARRAAVPRREALPALLYFACLGAGFIVVELVLMSKFTLLIGFPIYAMATVLVTLLVAAGAGSALSGRLARKYGDRAVLPVVPAIALVVLTLLAGFPALRDLTLGLGQLARVLLVAAAIAPLGVVLGMPFPLGIDLLHRRAPALVPWAWGVNAFMTVVGSLLAVILSMRVGFDATLATAVAIYGVAMASYWAMRRAPGARRGAQREAW